MREIYLNEYNVLMDNTVYYPLVCGQLKAYAQTKAAIRENYEFMPFLFIRDLPGRIVAQYNDPAVAGFSCSMWNINLSLVVAQQVKERFPGCLIVFGGPSVPLEPTDFFVRYPFVDITVRGEGEHTFAELLLRLLLGRDFSDVAGICYPDYYQRQVVRNPDRTLEENLDTFPSSYLQGLYDYLLPSGINFQAIVETNRGCPFKCSYCFWGVGKRYRFFSLNRVRELADWCGAHRIRYVFCADSNFGMLERDLEIAKYFVEAKTKYGFPDKLRACYGKNAEETIYLIGKLLHKHDMEKGITLSRQSNNAEALKNVGRRNIKKSVYDDLQKRYNEDNIPTYTELILGLPGETYESFLNGMEEILQSGIKNQLIVYICEVYPNTELANPEYQKRFGVSTVRIPLTEIHGSVRPEGIPQEYNEIVVSTSTMPIEDWKRALVISWIMQLLHGLKLAFYVLDYMVEKYHISFTSFFEYIAGLTPQDAESLGNQVVEFYRFADSIAKGQPRGCILADFGSIYWEPEEVAYLSLYQKKDKFYEDMHQVCRDYLNNLGIIYDANKLKKVIEHQRACIPNIADYKEKATFAREIVIRGRKSGKMLKEVSSSNVQR
ncbi:cobalamin-dependent protein [Patescibacteria group bacterium]|nr:cobalamin-dependent protein [Patescibacteria group bacterium]